MRRLLGRSLLACIVVVITGAVAGAAAGALTPPSQDPFYTSPASLASYKPGTVIRSREVTPLGLTDSASATA